MRMTTATRKTPSLTAAWEQGAAFAGRPVAVEFTFTAPVDVAAALAMDEPD